MCCRSRQRWRAGTQPARRARCGRRHFVDEVCAAVAADTATASPLALRLNIGLPATVPLFALHDLDNYLFPLVPKLTARTGRTFVSVWAAKRHAATSEVAVGPVVRADDPGGTHVFDVTTTASASTRRYKEQIRDQIATASPLPGNGLALQVAFVIGPHRAWANLWKPTIDALGAILGRDGAPRMERPRRTHHHPRPALRRQPVRR